MHKRTILYRGNLKSCNYSCSYCPFAKHRVLPTELERDRQNFIRFCDSVERRAQAFNIGAVFITPYGEASIHSWYWEGLSRLAGLSGIDRVGMQTNLSFSVEECLKLFDLFPKSSGRDKNAGKEKYSEREDYLDKGEYSERNFPEKKREKLSIWATFHPEMTTVDEFVSKCHKLVQNKIRVCAGAVGVPENIQLIRELREKLSPIVYLWINQMDGLKRNYRPEEVEAFVQIDPFFEYELNNPEVSAQMCADRCFVEADGKLRSCNISKVKNVNWYDGNEEEIFVPVCSGKRCSCYLAYGGRKDFALKNIFGHYSVYRIPQKFRAIFFDLDGTLISVKKRTDAKPSESRHERGLSDQVRRKLAVLGETCPVFLATSMPEMDVRKRLQADMDLFQGFIFASGGYLFLRDGNCGREKIYPIDVNGLAKVQEYGENVKAKYAVSVKKGTAYKVTLMKGHHSIWSEEECSRVADLLKESGCRFFTEKNCLEIVSMDRNKGTGIEEICGWLGIPTEDVLAVGNDNEDEAMRRVCGAYVKVER